MAQWIELTNGLRINLEMIEAISPDPNLQGCYRFFPPRTQRGGRPIGRPTDRPADWNEHDGYWRGEPVDLDAFLQALTPNPFAGVRVTAFRPATPEEQELWDDNEAPEEPPN